MATQSNNMHNLTTLIKRLEAATSRLEDMATTTFSSAGSSKSGPGSITSTSPQQSRDSASATATSQPVAQVAPPVVSVPESVEEFDEVINGPVQAFVTKSKDVDAVVADQASEVKKSFDAQRKILLLSTKSKKPDTKKPIFMEILKDLQGRMEAVSQVAVKNPRTPFTNHLKMVNDGIGQLGWIMVEPKPANYVKEMADASRFWGDKIFKEHREKNPAHVEWVRAFYAISAALQEYVQKNHAMGVAWNNKDGLAPEEALKQANAATAAPATSAPPPPPGAAGGPPPPPPPPPPPSALLNPPPPPGAAPKSGGGDIGAVFDQLNRGEAVTSGLKKVTADMQTHKNPNLRAAAPIARSDSASSRGKSPAPGRPLKPESMRTKKPPRKELEMNKWIIENFDSPSDMIEIEAAQSHSILISRCQKTTIRVIGKANAISIDSSSRVSLIIDSLISSVDVIKTPRFEMQVLGTLPTVMLDQVDGAAIYLSKESESTEVFTSKCTSVNISIPEGEDGDYVECPIPEQLVTRIRNGKAVSEIVEHAG